jgi:hypothetical protein
MFTAPQNFYLFIRSSVRVELLSRISTQLPYLNIIKRALQIQESRVRTLSVFQCRWVVAGDQGMNKAHQPVYNALISFGRVVGFRRLELPERTTNLYLRRME